MQVTYSRLQLLLADQGPHTVPRMQSRILSLESLCFTSARQPSYETVFLTVSKEIGTLRYEDGKARTGTAVDEGNFHGSRCVVKNKMLKMRIFSKDGDVNNSNFVKAIPFTETVTSFRL